MNLKRVREILKGYPGSGAVIYWMSREQRVYDNWSLVFAQEQAAELQVPLIVIFNFVQNYPGAGYRQYKFMVDGLLETEKELNLYNISFKLLSGDPGVNIPKFLEENDASMLITDFDPLSVKTGWIRKISDAIEIPFYEVDSHNIVPCWIASPKREFSAGTFRPKIHKVLNDFLDDFPSIRRMEFKDFHQYENNWGDIFNLINKYPVQPVDWIKPGESAALDKLDEFLEEKLIRYSLERNDPTKNCQSGLSPYLHFGNISSQRITLQILQQNFANEEKMAFLEELIIRKELSDNFCFYTECYDTFDGFPDWARQTLNNHRNDKRDFIYSPEELEFSKTHDDLWNAAQAEMANTGKMHGYMRMYWAKKILEWTHSPEEALQIAINLNDKYELDGRDPNGYTGIAWSIGGVHDRAWGEREIFGKIRYMSYDGMKRKFNIKEYINKNLL